MLIDFVSLQLFLIENLKISIDTKLTACFILKIFPNRVSSVWNHTPSKISDIEWTEYSQNEGLGKTIPKTGSFMFRLFLACRRRSTSGIRQNMLRYVH